MCRVFCTTQAPFPARVATLCAPRARTFIWISLAYATTWTVAVDGSGAFASIQAAVDASSDGDLIEVRAGTYFESVTLSPVCRRP